MSPQSTIPFHSLGRKHVASPPHNNTISLWVDDKAKATKQYIHIHLIVFLIFFNMPTYIWKGNLYINRFRSMPIHKHKVLQIRRPCRPVWPPGCCVRACVLLASSCVQRDAAAFRRGNFAAYPFFLWYILSLSNVFKLNSIFSKWTGALASFSQFLNLFCFYFNFVWLFNHVHVMQWNL